MNWTATRIQTYINAKLTKTSTRISVQYMYNTRTHERTKTRAEIWIPMTFFVVIFGSQLQCSLIAIIAIIHGMYLIILYHFRSRRVPADHHHRDEVEGLKSGCLYYYYTVIIILIATTSKINIKKAGPDDSLYLLDAFNHTVWFFFHFKYYHQSLLCLHNI